MRLVVSFATSYGKPDLNDIGVKNNISNDWWSTTMLDMVLNP
jgi:hypothetical protein